MHQKPPLSRPRAHALLHLTIFMWGVTAIIGKSISIAALPLVFYRVVIVTVLMGAVLVRRKIPFRITRRQLAELAAAGTCVGLHWVLFYGTVKEAGVAVAVICLSTITFFTALMEPVFLRRSVRRHELVLGLVVVVGVALLMRLELHASVKGYAMGLASAFFSAAFGTWNGSIVQRHPAERVTFYEIASAAVMCGLAFPILGGFVAPWNIGIRDWMLLGVLAVGCTMLPWLWSLRILRTLSPYTIAIAVALEPVYAVAIAYLLWPDAERLSARFYLGVVLILGVIAFNGWLKSRQVPQKV